MPWTSQFVSIAQNAEPHDAAAPSGAHKTNANESRFIVPPNGGTSYRQLVATESSVRKKREGRAAGRVRAGWSGAEPHRLETAGMKQMTVAKRRSSARRRSGPARRRACTRSRDRHTDRKSTRLNSSH